MATDAKDGGASRASRMGMFADRAVLSNVTEAICFSASSGHERAESGKSGHTRLFLNSNRAEDES